MEAIMRVMDGMRICAVVGAVSLGGVGAAHGASVVLANIKVNGATASNNSFDPGSGIAYDFTVSRNDTSSGTTTFFSFFTQKCDATFTICTGSFGNGFIPNGDFSASTGTASLNTNLLTNSGFPVFNYIQDNSQGTFTTSPGTGGLVNVTWKKIPRESQSMVGTQTFVFGPFSNKITGTQSFDNATPSGTFLGATLPANGFGFIGQNKSSQIIINRN
jgi:hypothetical protein